MTFPEKDQSPHTSKVVLWVAGSSPARSSEIRQRGLRGTYFNSDRAAALTFSSLVSQLPHSINKVKAGIQLAFEQWIPVPSLPANYLLN